MTELRCPVCNTVLDKAFLTDKVCGCPKCKNIGNVGLWELFADTKKKLDRAIWWLNEIVENHRFTPITTAEKALAEINQKEQQ